MARELAKRLGYRHVDTGAMYRAVAWKAVNDDVSLEDEDAVADVAQNAALTVVPGLVVIDGYDVTDLHSHPAIDRAARRRHGCPMRAALVARQRRRAGGGVVMEGRDIDSVVFPNADVKIYLDASPEERARRRAADPAMGSAARPAALDVASELEARDRSDRTRSPHP